MEDKKAQNHKIVLAVIVVLLGIMTTLVAYSPTLYRVFCAVTGFGGTVNRSVAINDNPSEDKNMPVVDVYFDSNVAPGLDWEFKPEQRSVKVHIGEPKKVYYYAKNNTDHTIVARALYNVTPYKAAPYFFKIQCFCFTEEKLGPGEEAHMPLVFYVDKQFLKDAGVQDVTRITLSYTFVKQDDASAEDVKSARDLGQGSKKLDKSLSKTGADADFANDVRRM